jgi:threonine dehydrogenase-like Zn-dependent dehydrogenase
MRRIALVDYGKLELQDNWEGIACLPGTAKVEVSACAICGSDLALFRGKRDLQSERYWGHEFSGVVVDAGAGANGITAGTRVASEVSRACGHCWHCRNGLPSLCKSFNEAFLPGGFSEETCVLNTEGNSFISRVPNTLDDITATLLEPTNCSLQCALKANIKPGEKVAIIGMGPRASSPPAFYSKSAPVWWLASSTSLPDWKSSTRLASWMESTAAAKTGLTRCMRCSVRLDRMWSWNYPETSLPSRMH